MDKVRVCNYQTETLVFGNHRDVVPFLLQERRLKGMAKSPHYIKGLEKIRTQLESELNDCSKKIGSNIADAISQDFVDEYQRVVDEYYSEYTPKVYKRHAYRGLEPGLNLSYRRFKSGPHGVYYGGIEITSNYMYKDYKRDIVLNSFLNGYHGDPSLGIYSNTEPYQHMVKLKELIISNIDSYIPEALNKARIQNNYTLLKF